MSHSPVHLSGPLAARASLDAQAPAVVEGVARGTSPAVPYGVALLLVALATGLGFSLEDVIGAPNLTLVFVLPVIATATWFGWGPSLAATVAGVLAFDFFFTAPRYSLEIASASDIGAAVLLLVIAAIVSAAAAQSRRRALAAGEAAEQARALHALAHVVIDSGRPDAVLAAAATALNRIFRAPAVVLLRRAGGLHLAAAAGGARVTPAEEEAARGALDSRVRSRAQAYPFVNSAFDFWPVGSGGPVDCAIGVDLSASDRAVAASPDRTVDMVGAYLAVALARSAEAG